FTRLLPLQKLCCFDEPTQADVTMTESHTPSRKRSTPHGHPPPQRTSRLPAPHQRPNQEPAPCALLAPFLLLPAAEAESKQPATKKIPLILSGI
ncbi:MAG TPA: hypothetical protein VF043_36260, partial [Ktedonobacteraceae bacterium]